MEGTTTMNGVDEFGLTRTQRVAMADDELAEARELGRRWMYPTGFPDPGMLSQYVGLLNSAATLYQAEGLRLLARRVLRVAREVEVPRAWNDFDRLNAKPA